MTKTDRALTRKKRQAEEEYQMKQSDKGTEGKMLIDKEREETSRGGVTRERGERRMT